MKYYPGSQSFANNRHTPLLFWLMVLALGGVAHLGVSIGASYVLGQKDAEKPLQGRVLLPKLSSSLGDRKAEPFRTSEHEPSELNHPKERKTEPLGSPVPQVELAPSSFPETCSDPIVYVQPCSPHRGDSPMIRNWKTFSLYSLLSAATVMYVAPPPIVAGAPEAKKTDTLEDLAKRIKALEEKKQPTLDQDAIIEAIKSELDKLKTGMLADINRKLKDVGEDVKTVTRNVETLKSEMTNIQTEQLRQKLQLDNHKFLIDQLAEQVRGLQKKHVTESSPAPVDKASLEEIRGKLATIQDMISKMGPTEVRKAMAMPDRPLPTSNTAKVMLVNLYSDEVTFVVNGAVHRVPARTHKLLENVPIGALNYEVFTPRWGMLDRQMTTLVNGETFTLTASVR